MNYINSDDKLDILIKLAISKIRDEEATIFDDIECDTTIFSRKYKYNKKRLIFYSRHQKALDNSKKILYKIAMVALAIMSAAFISIMSISALRTPLLNTIVQWYNEYIAIYLDTNNIDESNSKQAQITEFKKPLYIPSNLTEVLIEKNIGMHAFDYYLDTEFRLSFSQTTIENNNYLFDDSSDVKPIRINQHDGTIVHNKDTGEIDLIWNDEKYVYWIYSLLSIEETIKIAQTVG